MNSLFSLQELLTTTNGALKNCCQEDNIRIRFVTTDSRQDCHDSLFIPLVGERFDGHDYVSVAIDMGAEVVLLDAKHSGLAAQFVATPCIIVDDTLKAYQQLANAHRNRLADLTLIAITGSCGKTSSKEILLSILSEEFGKEHVYATLANTNNHIGVPQNILRITPEHKVAIIELGTNHPGEIETLTQIAEPDIAVITSIGASHLEFFNSIDNVAVEKSTIFNGVKPGGAAIIPLDTPYTSLLEKAADGLNITTFGQTDKADSQCRYLNGTLQGSQFVLACRDVANTVEWALAGKHQAMNAAACAAVAMSMGIAQTAVINGLRNCVLPGMRMKVTSHDNITWINDAYNANPSSMLAGLNWLLEFVDPRSAVLILGDMLELGECSQASHLEVINFVLSKFTLSRIYLIGPEMESALKLVKIPHPCRSFPDSSSAISFIREQLVSGSVVFLKASRGTKLEIIQDTILTEV